MLLQVTRMFFLEPWWLSGARQTRDPKAEKGVLAHIPHFLLQKACDSLTAPISLLDIFEVGYMRSPHLPLEIVTIGVWTQVRSIASPVLYLYLTMHLWDQPFFDEIFRSELTQTGQKDNGTEVTHLSEWWLLCTVVCIYSYLIRDLASCMLKQSVLVRD